MITTLCFQCPQKDYNSFKQRFIVFSRGGKLITRALVMARLEEKEQNTD